MAITFHLMKIQHMLLGYKSFDHMINNVYNLKIRKITLINYTTAFLDYIHQFSGSLYGVDSR